MEPLLVTAVLRSAPVARAGPMMLDGILLAGLGRRAGLAHPSGWAPEAEVLALPLPLARVERDGAWWYAASQSTPHGPEQTWHIHRRPPVTEAAVWTSARGINHSAGPDKAQRKRTYYRPAMRHLAWTCVGDRDEVTAVLSMIDGVGPMIAHGFGWVDRWDVHPGGPDLDAYASDLRLRHLPAASAPPLPVGWPVTRRRLSLIPPYYDRGPTAVECLQVPHERP